MCPEYLIWLCRAIQLFHYIKGKDKAIPLQAWTGPKCSRSLRLSDFKTIGT